MIRSSIDIDSEFLETYNLYTDIGKQCASDYKVLITGIVRDLSDSIENSTYQLMSLKNLFKDLKIFIVENDSVDDTKNKLVNIKNLYKDNFNYLSRDLGLPRFGSIKSLERTTILADQRNEYIRYINNSNTYDYIIVADLDFLTFSIDGLMNSFGWMSTKSIDAMCGVSVRYQNVLSDKYKNYWNYDCWAYRGNWWKDKQLEVNDCNPMLWFGFWIPLVGSPPFKVNSGFGGMCIYKASQLSQSLYQGYDCEHVCLHKQMYERFDSFDLYMNPSQITTLL